MSATDAEIAWDRETIPRVVARAAERWGDRPAIEDGEVRLTYRELHDRSLTACRAFIAAGVETGDRVGVWAPNIWEWIVAAIGLQSAGGVLVPLNTRFKPAEAGFVLRKSRARVLCTVGDFLDTNYADSLTGESLPDLEHVVLLRGDAEHGTPFETFLGHGDDVSHDAARARAESVRPEDLSDLLFTSGTTGDPKGVMCAHGQNLKVFDVWSREATLREQDRYLIIPPFFHTFGYKAGWLSCIIRGATAIPQLVFDVHEVMARIAKERITALPGPPTIYQSILAEPSYRDHDLSSLRVAITGAAPVPVELVERMRSELGFETVLTAYGLTESCGTVTMCTAADDAETISHTSGRPLPDLEVRCIDEQGGEVPRGEPGELVVRGYSVMQGYFDDPEATASTIDAEGWLHTGDIAVMDERGYVRITDRIKDMYICGGFNVYPAEIEKALFAHEGIAASAVIGIPDERMGEVGMAFVVPVGGAKLDPDEIVAWSRERLANYKVPRRVEVVDELPTNATGKVMKFVLRERVGS